MTLPLTYSHDVREALDAGRPLVALESTIITHGMPYPANLETAQGVEDVVRANGAVPATIAIIDREINIGSGNSYRPVSGAVGMACAGARCDETEPCRSGLCGG